MTELKTLSIIIIKVITLLDRLGYAINSLLPNSEQKNLIRAQNKLVKSLKNLITLYKITDDPLLRQSIINTIDQMFYQEKIAVDQPTVNWEFLTEFLKDTGRFRYN